MHCTVFRGHLQNLRKNRQGNREKTCKKIVKRPHLRLKGKRDYLILFVLDKHRDKIQELFVNFYISTNPKSQAIIWKIVGCYYITYFSFLA